LRSPLHGDTYHSLRGAVGEARHVFIEAGFAEVAGLPTVEAGSDDIAPAASTKDIAAPLRILETGFGTGLNAWLTLAEAERAGRRVEYTSVELYPVAEETAARLGYTADPHFMALHRAPWGEWSEPAEGFRLLKLHVDLAAANFWSTFAPSAFDCVYWDAFAPDTQPELWTVELFARVFRTVAPGGVLVTYSAKGDVRRALSSAGFMVEKLPGALGKRHMLRARKP
jgi:tRNA U34 5-methylaminomethyl-2-thiouridine-forming methyltransferase MnmC